MRENGDRIFGWFDIILPTSTHYLIAQRATFCSYCLIGHTISPKQNMMCYMVDLYNINDPHLLGKGGKWIQYK